MSWYVKTVGSKKAVTKLLTGEQNVPETVKTAILAQVALMPADQMVVVETHGHFDRTPPACSHQTAEVKVYPIAIAPEPTE